MTPQRLVSILAASVLALGIIAGQRNPARTVTADPSNYRELLHTLNPGDTLELAPGVYRTLPIAGLNGTYDAWITIRGPASGNPATIVGVPDLNTVEIVNSSYVLLQNLRIDSRGIPGAFGVSARGEDNLTHHIRLEWNTFVGQNGSQQTDGISTKTPTWGWAIRYNHVIGAGTGIYLGNSDGSFPFVAGLIENNLIRDTIGYDMEVKHQNSIPPIPGIPVEPTSTIIRNNVFVKNDQPSPDGDRPNVLLGASPAAGPGSLNTYEVYGNLFLHNHREALLQAAGRVSVHDNIFVDGPYEYPALVFRNHNGGLRMAHVYNNTIYTAGRGIYFGSTAAIEDAVIGNLVFAQVPISGPVMQQQGNITDSVDHASKYVRGPSFEPGSMDLYPATERCAGPPLALSYFRDEADYDQDFNGRPKGGATVYRGAYAGSGSNPGWTLQVGVKPPNPPSARAGK